ncbi:MAG TPA: homoserine kinase [Armatimonadota bacterium]|jgi:homoserine kinase
MRPSVTVQIPASTANLGPGFDCLGLALSLYNTVTLAPADATEVAVTGEGAGRLPADESNLVLRAAAALAARAGVSVPGWRLHQHNDIPLCRGLGSSSAAIVGGIVAADRLLELDTPAAELLDLAAELEGHPDNVAPALYGGLTVCAAEEGRVLCVAGPAPADLHIAAVIPDFEVSTEEARGVLPTQYSREDTVYNLSHACLTLAALQQGRYDLLGRAMRDRVHQPHRVGLVPGMAEVIERALLLGAQAAALSGSGPTVACFADREVPGLAEAVTAGFARQGLLTRVLWLRPSAGALEL